MAAYEILDHNTELAAGEAPAGVIDTSPPIRSEWQRETCPTCGLEVEVAVEQGIGNREQGTGNREQGIGNRKRTAGHRSHGDGPWRVYRTPRENVVGGQALAVCRLLVAFAAGGPHAIADLNLAVTHAQRAVAVAEQLVTRVGNREQGTGNRE